MLKRRSIVLTKRQMKILEPLFEQERRAVDAGEDAMIIAQLYAEGELRFGVFHGAETKRLLKAGQVFEKALSKLKEDV